MRPAGPPVPAAPLGAVPLTDGQAVTVLVAVGLAVLSAHREGDRVGPQQRGCIVVDAGGRPRLRPASPPDGWTEADDRAAWLRLGWSLTGPASPLAARVGSWSRAALPLEQLVPLLLEVARPQPLPGFGAVSRPGRGRHAGRRRSWGRGRRSPPR